MHVCARTYEYRVATLFYQSELLPFLHLCGDIGQSIVVGYPIFIGKPTGQRGQGDFIIAQLLPQAGGSLVERIYIGRILRCRCGIDHHISSPHAAERQVGASLHTRFLIG